MELTISEALQRGVAAHKEGKLQEAEKFYRSILQSQPQNADANHNLGVLAVGVGKVEGALPHFKAAIAANANIEQYWLSYIDALTKLGRVDAARDVLRQAQSAGFGNYSFSHTVNNAEPIQASLNDPPKKILQQLQLLFSKNQPQEVLRIAVELKKEYKKSSALFNICGAAFSQLEKYDCSISRYRQAIRLNPDYPEALYNLAIAFSSTGRVTEAITSYRRAVAIRPRYAQAHGNLGIMYKTGQQDAMAILSYKRAITLSPQYSEAYNNLGVSMKTSGELDPAIRCYNYAVKTVPSYADAYNNLGNIFKARELWQKAIESYKLSIQFKPNNPKAYSGLGDALRHVSFLSSRKDLHLIIIELLQSGTFVRPLSIARSVLSLLRSEPKLNSLLDGSIAIRNTSDFYSTLNTLYKFPLLQSLMEQSPIPDIKVEHLLCELRKFLILNLQELQPTGEQLMFLQSLALHCFTNEYVYFETSQEKQLVSELALRIKNKTINKEELPPLDILCLACFRPLYSFSWSGKLVFANKYLSELEKRHIKDRATELELKGQLPRLLAISDRTSIKVQKQYEESPYPRWIGVGIHHEPMSVRQMTRSVNLKAEVDHFDLVSAPEILIAGCGTGQHSIQTARTYKDCNVLAVDLSLASLSYAQRKTQELGIDNITYVQSDILQLGGLEKLLILLNVSAFCII